MRLLTWLRRAALLWAGLLVYSNVAMYERFSLRRPLVELASLAALFCSNCVPSLMIGPSDTFHRQLGLDALPAARVLLQQQLEERPDFNSNQSH